MSRTLNRREFLITPVALPLIASAASRPRETQTFRVGYAPEFGVHRTDQRFWEACDACARLGFHYVETNDSGMKISESYAGRVAEFKEKMSKRKLTLVGLAVGSNMVDPGKRQQVIDQHLKVGRFLQAVGGHYIALLFDFPRDPRLPREEALRRMSQEDFRNFAQTVNEVGKQLGNETGIHIGYHPERHEVMAGIVGHIMEMTEPKYLGFLPDVGQIAGGGGNPLEMYKKHRSRLIATHLKDWDPNLTGDRNPPGERGGFVALGKGVVDFPSLMAFLKQTRFTGEAMVELDGQADPTQEMKDYLVKKLDLSLT